MTAYEWPELLRLAREAEAAWRARRVTADPVDPAALARVRTEPLEGEQRAAVDAVRSWFAGRRGPVFRLTGLAGTGKSTVAARLQHDVPGMYPVYCAPTGRATQVLRTKLRSWGISTAHDTGTASDQTGDRVYEDRVRTVHSLIRVPVEFEWCGCERCETDSQGRVPRETCSDPRRGKTGRVLVDVAYEMDDDTLMLRGAELRRYFNVVVLDEASMVSKELWLDLLKLRLPVLAVGDRGQLPPIGNPDDDRDFSALATSDFELREIRRQARGNAIYPIAAFVRSAHPTQRLSPGWYRGEASGFNVCKTPDWFTVFDWGYRDAAGVYHPVDLTSPDTLLVCCYRKPGTTRPRHEWNHIIRVRAGYPPEPVVGDRVICLRNSTAFQLPERAEDDGRHVRIFNGMRGTIREIRAGDSPEVAPMLIYLDDLSAMVEVTAWLPQFGEPYTTREEIPGGVTLWDFGYALTVHSAQGTEADHVIVDDPGGTGKRGTWDWNRWRYTAVTRAKKSLLIIGR